MTRVSALLSLIVIGALTAGTDAQEPPIEIESPITEITIYPQGALSAHRTRVDLPRGRSLVTLILDPDLEADRLPVVADYRLTTVGCRLLEHSIRSVIKPAAPERLKYSERVLAERSSQAQEAEALKDETRSDLVMLETMGRTLAEQVDLTDPDSVRQLQDFLTTQRREIAAELRRREARVQALGEALAQSERDHQTLHSGTRQLEAHLLVDTDLEGPVELIVSRFLKDAGWSQELSITRFPDRATAEVSLLARINNETSENWNDVDLTLSTVENREFQMLRMLEPATIGIEPEQQDSATDPGTPREAQTPSSERTNLEAFHTLPTPVTLERDQSKVLLIERFETACALEYLARPLVDSSCHVLSRLRNETEQRISQAVVTLHQEGVMVGTTEIEQTPSGAPFTISWGLRPNLQIDRELLERRSIRTGLLNGGRLTQMRFRITIRNLEAEGLELVLEDRLPSSLSDDIEIRVTEPSDPTMEFSEDTGRLRWVLALPPGGPQAAPTVVEWTAEIRHSADIRTTPIPE